MGDSSDNPFAKTINGLYKAERIHRRGPWRSFEAVEFATLTWADWFDHRRLLEPIGNIPPAEAEGRYHAMLEEPAIAARLKPNENPGRFIQNQVAMSERSALPMLYVRLVSRRLGGGTRSTSS